MSAYSWGLEISRRSDSILWADAMTKRSDEITMGNPNILHGLSHSGYSDATNIAVNQ